MKIKMKTIFVIPLFYLISLTSCEPHSPKLQENNFERYQTLPEDSKRSSKPSFKTGHLHFQPLPFDFKRAQSQQDNMLKHKYFQQQKSDIESYKRRTTNAKMAKAQGDFFDKTRDEDDWVPITSSTNEELQDISDKRESKSRDLESADSEIIEAKIKPAATDRKDAHGKYIYIQPSILKNSFGLDSKTAQDILKKSAPTRDDGYHLDALANLLDKNPKVQLEGLHSLIQQSDVFPEHQNSNLNSVQETEDAFTVAQKHADAHLQAQHQAIAQAQKRLEAEALAKIAAHNNGQINIDPKEIAKMQDETIARLKLLESDSSPQRPQFAALVSDPTQTYGGHFKEEHSIQHFQVVPSPQTPEQVQHAVFQSSTSRTRSPLENYEDVQYQQQKVVAAPGSQNLIAGHHQEVFVASTPRTLAQHQVHPSLNPQTFLNQNQGQQQQIIFDSTPRTIYQHQVFPSSAPQTLLKQSQQHQVYLASTPRTIHQHQSFPSSTPHTFLRYQEKNPEQQQQIFFASSTPKTLLKQNQEHQHRVYLASTPETIYQHQEFPSSTPQPLLKHQEQILEQQHRMISQPQFYASSAPDTLFRHQVPRQQAYLQHVQGPVAFKNLPPITAPEKLSVQAPRRQVFVPQIQTHSDELSKTKRPQVFLQHQEQVRQQHEDVRQASQQLFLQTPRPEISIPQHQQLLFYQQTQPQRVGASTPQLTQPRVVFQGQTPPKYKQVAYSAQINHFKNSNGMIYPTLQGASPTQAFVQGNQVSTIYAPSYRAPVPEHSISYVNVGAEPQKSQPVYKNEQVQFVVTPAPNNIEHNVLNHKLKTGVPSIEEQDHQHLALVGHDNYGDHQNQLNYDDQHQYAANYAFGYKIADHQHGNDYGHEEKKDGKNTKGHYYVNLPDGRRQKVEYYVDDDGYHANVSYENIAEHETNFPHKK